MEGFELPHDERAERILLGQLLANPDYYLEIHQHIKPRDFYKSDYRAIFETFVKTYLDRGKVELMDVVERKGGIPFSVVHACIEEGELYRSNDWALRTVLDLSSKRMLQKGLYGLQQEIGERTEQEICEDLMHLVADVRRLPGQVFDQDEMINKMKLEIDRNAAQEDHIGGLRTGFKWLDAAFGGLVEKRITLISGRTNHGKTSLALNWMTNICVRNKIPGLFITVEMREEDVMNRVLGIVSNQKIRSIATGCANLEDMAEAYVIYRNGRLYVSDNAPRTIHDVVLTIEKYAIRNKIKIWCLDYLGRLERDNPKMKEDRDERYARWVKMLWNVTQRHNLHGIIISQVNYLEEVAESKKVEHEADHHVFFKRHFAEGIGELECRKNRFGRTNDRYRIEFDVETQRMKENGYFSDEATREKNANHERFADSSGQIFS